MICPRYPTAFLAIFLAFSVLLAKGPARAEDDLAALQQQLGTLYQQGKYAEALPLAERQAELLKAQLGEAHADYAAALSDQANVLKGLNRPAEAEALLRKAIAIEEASLGPNHEDVATDLKSLADLLQRGARLAEAEALDRRALAIDEANRGPAGAVVAGDLNVLALVLRDANRLAEAEPMLRRSLEITETLSGPDHPDVAVRLNSLAVVLVEAGRQAEAEPLLRRALAITEAHQGAADPMVAVQLGNLAQTLLARSALAEAEPLMRRALEVDEKQPAIDDAKVASDLANLAALLLQTERPAEAEPMMRRALALDEARLGPNHPRVGTHLNNLAQALASTGRFAEAEPLLRRSLAINEAALGPNHPMVAKNLNNLAQVLRATDRVAEAEPLMRRSLAITEADYGPDSPITAETLNNLADLLKPTASADELEPLMRRVLAIFEKELGPEHPHVATALNNLAMLMAERGDWANALTLVTRSASIHTADARRNSTGAAPTMRRLTQEARAEQLLYVLSAYQTRADHEGSVNDSFLAAQRALATEAAAALAQASARFAAGTGALAELVRALQDRSAARAAADKRLLTALAKGNKTDADDARGEEAKIDTELDAMSARLAREFPDYAALANPEPLTIEAVQRLLKPDEVFIQFLNLSGAGKLPEDGFVWAISKTAVRWASLGRGTAWFQAGVALMRCGLDRSNWEDASNWPEDTQAAKDSKTDQLARRERCRLATGVDNVERRALPFPLNGAYNFYKSLFGEIADMIAGKELLIVPAGALTAFPFQVLVTQPPAAGVGAAAADFTNVAWLGQSNAITILPSAASLEALRRIAKPTKASEPFAAFGNPLLIGPFGTNNLAWGKQDCAKLRAGAEIPAIPRGFTPPSAASLLGVTDVERLRRQWPLPETADELCNVAGVLGAPSSAVHLGRDATEGRVKQLSARGELSQARIIHFATHGLLPGETETVSQVRPEPALMLTPPDRPSEEDDGLLTASEVAQLQLDADWVVLSACNTAAASEARAEEDLSGLARAFFYAGARALLVSHWYVDSQVTVDLITRTFSAMKLDPHIGRAEALRRAITAVIGEGGGMTHPSKWGPFIVVGEGSGS